MMNDDSDDHLLMVDLQECELKESKTPLIRKESYRIVVVNFG